MVTDQRTAKCGILTVRPIASRHGKPAIKGWYSEIVELRVGFQVPPV